MVDDIDAPASVEDIDEARDWFGRDPDVRERAEERGITSATLIVGALIAWVLRHAEANAGEPYDKFAESIRKRIEAAWMSPNAVAAQTATHEALQRSYINERVQGLRDGSNGRPQMWRFIAVLDRRTTSACLGYHGTERYSNDPGWAGKIPPLHP